MSSPISPSAAFDASQGNANSTTKETASPTPSNADPHPASPAGEPTNITSPRAETVESIGKESSRSTPEPGLIDESATDQNGDVTAEQDSAPPLPDEAPPLPNEAPPGQAGADADDGWQPVWDGASQMWWFYNRYTGTWQLDNPRVPSVVSTAETTTPGPSETILPPKEADQSAISDLTSVAGGYNPAIHGSYDPNAWYAQNSRAAAAQEAAATQLQNSYQYATAAFFNRATGQWQMPEMGVERHSDEAKSRRQMNAYFDVDAAANQHDGRSLKAERAGKKPTKAELKAFKEKRKAKKEEKRRAWLRD